MKEIGEITVLVVEDESLLRESIVFGLKRRGFHVLQATGGRAAYDLLEGHAVDVILSDIMMPDGDGIELMTKALAREEPPQVILMTGYSPVSSEQCEEMGAAAVVQKPFNSQRLFDQILECLGVQSPKMAFVHISDFPSGGSSHNR
jgi:CheY-like chemotaxis protein